MKILLDGNIPQVWKGFVERHRHETLHWREIGDVRAEDTEIMAWAGENRFRVFTHDLDFGSRLFSTNAKGPSIIQLGMENILPSKAGKTVTETLMIAGRELEKGALVTIYPERHGIRLLPLDKKPKR